MDMINIFFDLKLIESCIFWRLHPNRSKIKINIMNGLRRRNDDVDDDVHSQCMKIEFDRREIGCGLHARRILVFIHKSEYLHSSLMPCAFRIDLSSSRAWLSSEKYISIVTYKILRKKWKTHVEQNTCWFWRLKRMHTHFSWMVQNCLSDFWINITRHMGINEMAIN